MKLTRDTLIASLFKRREISARASNLCDQYRFVRVEDLVEYYERHRSFRRLNNLGEKSNAELVRIVELASETELAGADREITSPQEGQTIVEKKQSGFGKATSYAQMCAALDTLRTDCLSFVFSVNKERLSGKVQKVIDYLAGTVDTPQEFLASLEKLKYDYGNIKGIGPTTAGDLEWFTKELISSMEKITDPVEGAANCRKAFTEGYAGKIKGASQRLKDFLRDYYDKADTREFPFLKFVTLLVTDSDTIAVRSREITLSEKGYLKNFDRLSCSELGARYGLKEPRIRQLMHEREIDRHFWAPLVEQQQVLFRQGLKISHQHFFDEGECIFINEAEINKISQTELSGEFIARAFVSLNDRYAHFVYRTSAYLMRKEIAASVELSQIVKEVEHIGLSRRSVAKQLNLKELILRRSKRRYLAPDMIARVSSVVVQLLQNELTLVPDADGNLVFEPTTRKSRTNAQDQLTYSNTSVI